MLWRLIDRSRAPAPDAQTATWLSAQPYAHRGVHGPGVAENSSTAFALAIDAGVGIECDVRLTRDGRALVFHDAEIDRLTGSKGVVDKLTVGELTKVSLLEGGETLPTLRDLLDQVAGQVPLLIEVKVDRGQSVGMLCRAVRRDLEGYLGNVAVMSFDPRVGAWFSRKAPSITRGLVVTEENRRTLVEGYKRHLSLWLARPQFLAYDIRDLPSKFAQGQRRRGLPLLTWTVSTPALRERAHAYADAPIAEGQGLA